MKRVLAILIVAVLIISCTQQRTLIVPILSEEYLIIDIDGEEMGYTASDLFESGRVVYLETTTDSHIASIDRIICDSRYIYILDSRLQAVFIFDQDGKYIEKIKNIGRGPGEYIQLSDITIDDNGNIILLSNNPEKLIVLNVEGKVIRQISLDNTYMDMAYGQSTFVFSNSPYSKSAFTSYNVVTGHSDNILKSFLPYNSIYSHGHFLTQSDSSIIMTRRFDACFYMLENEKIVNKGEVRFHKYSFISKNELQSMGSSRNFYEQCRKENKIFTMVDCQIIDSVWVMNTNLSSCCLYSFRTNRNFVISSIYDDNLQSYLGGFSRMAISGGPNSELCFALAEDGLRQIGKDINENPVLFFYKLRQDL